MPKTAPCPMCQSPVKVPADAEPGDQLTCPSCLDEFAFKPGKRPAEPAPPADDDEEEEAPRRKKKRKKKREPASGMSTSVVAWVVGPLLILVGAAIMVGAFTRAITQDRRASKLIGAVGAMIAVGGAAVLFPRLAQNKDDRDK